MNGLRKAIGNMMRIVNKGIWLWSEVDSKDLICGLWSGQFLRIEVQVR